MAAAGPELLCTTRPAAKSRDKLNLCQELLTRLKESQRSLGEATAVVELPKKWCLL